MSAPKLLRVEYEDGSTKEIDFSKIDKPTIASLSKLGLCQVPAEVASARHYLLLRWKDGWQEVIGVDSDTVELLRYYVITRVEDRARLALEVGESWPELYIIKRTPRDVTSILIVGSDGARLYSLDAELERWEGTFEAGGKKEYVKFDKTNPRAPQELRDASDELSRLVESAKKELAERGLHPGELLAMDLDGRLEMYRELAKTLGLKAMQRQEDVHGLVEFLVRLA
jgi:hypothetical protein